MNFEWHDEKAESNLVKHGVDFVDAAQIFANPRFEAIDERHDYGELRIRAIGHHDGVFYVVIYTMRDQTCRLISAWKAGEDDRKEYHARFA